MHLELKLNVISGYDKWLRSNSVIMSIYADFAVMVCSVKQINYP